MRLTRTMNLNMTITSSSHENRVALSSQDPETIPHVKKQYHPHLQLFWTIFYSHHHDLIPTISMIVIYSSIFSIAIPIFQLIFNSISIQSYQDSNKNSKHNHKSRRKNGHREAIVLVSFRGAFPPTLLQNFFIVIICRTLHYRKVWRDTDGIQGFGSMDSTLRPNN